ncbi:hypothetical protein [Peptoniphilus senegalensis]|uniref:hypothetical protein n=1 Tax=Peptoniphilus senegalensis TaxID=1465757 RepID=UPI00031D7575|nr:hypothetical protein [Peptoniphilus senegalensis]
MIKTINIDGKEVKFSTNAYFANIFKNQFGYDILTVIMPLVSEALKGLDDLYTRANQEAIVPSTIGEVLENIYSLEMVDVNNFIWSLAKMADPGIDEPIKWYSQFNEFPVIDILKELWEIILPSLISKKKLEDIVKIPKAEKENQ